MNPLETPLSPASYRGHVKNGVVVLDTGISLAEGQEVRVEPILPKDVMQASDLEAMKRMFAQWDEEDSQVSDEVAEEFHQALERNHGLRFRTPTID